METIDGLAFIGRNPMDEENVYIATGDSGMGMTHGTIAGMLLTDLILGRENPWARALRPVAQAGLGHGLEGVPRRERQRRQGVRQGLARRRRRVIGRGDPARATGRSSAAA